MNTRSQKPEKRGGKTNAKVSVHDTQPREFGGINEERGDKPNLRDDARRWENLEEEVKYRRHIRRLEGFRPALVQVVGAEPTRFSGERGDDDPVVEPHLIRM